MRGEYRLICYAMYTHLCNVQNPPSRPHLVLFVSPFFLDLETESTHAALVLLNHRFAFRLRRIVGL
jgi:hypothetical protein